MMWNLDELPTLDVSNSRETRGLQNTSNLDQINTNK
jgi:hypothetical protein